MRTTNATYAYRKHNAVQFLFGSNVFVCGALSNLSNNIVITHLYFLIKDVHMYDY